jgi:AraC-like DNA-binding protein
MPSIGAHYFRVCTGGAERAGLSRPALLRKAGLVPQEMLAAGWRGSVQSMSLLVREIWAATGDEHMGCTGVPIRPGALAMMTELAMHAPTVLAALQKGIAFYALLTDAVETRLDAEGDDMALSVAFRHPEHDPDHYFIEFWMITWHRFASWLAGGTIAITFAEFAYPRPDAYFEEFKYLFPTRHRFDQPACRLHFERAPLLGAIARTEADRQAMIARAPLDFMTIPSSDHSLSRRVRRLLAPSAGAPFVPAPLDQIAAEIGLHPAALARGLRQEGTSLTRITENIRRDLAIARLQRGGATVEAIAADLGYAESRSFTRAFHHWTGVSPLRFRKNHLVAP